MVEAELTTGMKRAIEAFFQEKFGPLSFQYNHFIPQRDDKAKVDFTLNGENGFMRRYVGTASYENRQLSLQNVVRLW